MRMASLWRSRSEKPADEMAYWVEMLAKYGNMDHLRIEDYDLTLVEYYCLDVIAFYAVVVISFVIALYLALSTVFRLLWAATTNSWGILFSFVKPGSVETTQVRGNKKKTS